MRSTLRRSRSRAGVAVGAIVLLAFVGVLVALLPSGTSNPPVGQASAAPQQSPPPGGLLTSALARSLDPGLSARCRRALGANTVAALCDSNSRRLRRVRLSAPAFAMRRAKGAVVLVGSRALYARSRLRITGLQPTRRAQL